MRQAQEVPHLFCKGLLIRLRTTNAIFLKRAAFLKLLQKAAFYISICFEVIAIAITSKPRYNKSETHDPQSNRQEYKDEK